MLNDNLFYDSELLEHSLNPRHLCASPPPDCFRFRGVSASCGDDVTVSIRVKDGRIDYCSFSGESCAISRASADIMAGMLTGKTLDEAGELCFLFLRSIPNDSIRTPPDDLRPAAPLWCVRKLGSRKKCATLPWWTMIEVINNARAQADADKGTD